MIKNIRWMGKVFGQWSCRPESLQDLTAISPTHRDKNFRIFQYHLKTVFVFLVQSGNVICINNIRSVTLEKHFVRQSFHPPLDSMM